MCWSELLVLSLSAGLQAEPLFSMTSALIGMCWPVMDKSYVDLFRIRDSIFRLASGSYATVTLIVKPKLAS